MGLQAEPDWTQAIKSSADQTVSTKAPLTALPRGTSGILVTAHPGNGSVVIRVSGDDALAGTGQPLAAGASFLFTVANASMLSAIAESGSGKLCVSAT